MIHSLPISVVLCALFAATSALAKDADMNPSNGTVNQLAELTFTSNKAYADPFNDVQLDMLITAPDGAQLRVPAFWSGKQTWRVRYSSPQSGQHRWKIECSDASNRDLHGVTGTIDLKPYTGD